MARRLAARHAWCVHREINALPQLRLEQMACAAAAAATATALNSAAAAAAPPPAAHLPTKDATTAPSAEASAGPGGGVLVFGGVNVALTARLDGDFALEGGTDTISVPGVPGAPEIAAGGRGLNAALACARYRRDVASGCL